MKLFLKYLLSVLINRTRYSVILAVFLQLNKKHNVSDLTVSMHWLYMYKEFVSVCHIS